MGSATGPRSACGTWSVASASRSSAPDAADAIAPSDGAPVAHGRLRLITQRDFIAGALAERGPRHQNVSVEVHSMHSNVRLSGLRHRRLLIGLALAGAVSIGCDNDPTKSKAKAEVAEAVKN